MAPQPPGLSRRCERNKEYRDAIGLVEILDQRLSGHQVGATGVQATSQHLAEAVPLAWPGSPTDEGARDAGAGYMADAGVWPGCPASSLRNQGLRIVEPSAKTRRSSRPTLTIQTQRIRASRMCRAA